MTNITIKIRSIDGIRDKQTNLELIKKSAMNNAKSSMEIDGYDYSDNDWLKIISIADELDKVI